MKTYNTVLFDLDGTLTDPSVGITNSVEYALKKYGITVSDKRELFKFIGPPLKNSFMEFYDFSEKDAENAIFVYREYFSEKGIFENELYNGITELLSTLKSRGKTIVLATSKPEQFAIRILEHFDIIDYFDYICGATMDEKLCEKNDIIRYALSNVNSALEETIMVGDRCFDIIGAKDNSIDSIAVTYGFGSNSELKDAKPEYIAKTPQQILEIIK